MHESFSTFALSKFSGCDFNETEPDKRAIWLMGVEHGWPKGSLADAPEDVADDNANGKTVADGSGDDSYSVREQRGYRFNRDAFKLLAAMHGYGSNWQNYAQEHQPFVKGSPGFFKGNLYPYPCNNLDDWPERAIAETGLDSKAAYLAWCHTHRFPVIGQWVAEYQPRLIIASGFGSKELFAATLMKNASLARRDFAVPENEARHFFYAHTDDCLLVVTPHLSGSLLWASNASLQAAGSAIAALYEDSFGHTLAEG